MEDVKRALGRNLFFKDIPGAEPGKKGLQVGDMLRIFDNSGTITVSFLKGTDEKVRKTFRDKLTAGRVTYKNVADFTL